MTKWHYSPLLPRTGRNSRAIKVACANGLTPIVEMLAADGRKVSGGLSAACRNGHRETAEIILKESGSATIAIHGACRGGHPDFANELLERFGYTELCVNMALAGACRGGHIALVESMIAIGANDFDEALYEACSGGHIELARSMIARGATSFGNPLIVASAHGHLDIVREIFGRCRDFERTHALGTACASWRKGKSGCREVAIFLLDHGTHVDRCALMQAISETPGPLSELEERLISSIGLNKALRAARKWPNEWFAEYLLERGAHI